MTDTLKNISKERFAEEFKKLFLKSPKPSVGLQLAWNLGLFENTFPEFQYMPHTLQHQKHHPEGNVWTHTLLCVDAMAELLKDSNLDDDQRFTLFLAILCHDLGKPEVTWYDGQSPNWVAHAKNHEEAGLKPTKTFLEKLNISNNIVEKVLKIVEYHLQPILLYKQNAGIGAVRRLARKLYPVTLSELLIVAKADQAGRGKPLSEVDFTFAKWIEDKAGNVILQKKPEVIVTGKDLLKLGYNPGIRLGKVINKLTELHENFNLEKEELLDYAHFIMDKEEIKL